MKKALWIAALAALAVSPALWGQTITVTSPTASTDWCMGDPCTVTWTISGTVPANVAIRLRRDGAPNSEAAAWNLTGSTATAAGTYSASVPETLPAGRYYIRVKASDTIQDDSPAFDVIACTPAGSIRVTSPDADDSWQRGSRHTVTWTSSGTVSGTVSIRLRREGAPASEPAVHSFTGSTANDRSEPIDIPDSIPEGRYYIRVKASDTISGDSAVFSITKFLVATIVTPLLTIDQYDLAFTGAGLEYGPDRGFLIANIKNQGTALVDRDVNFSVVFPEMVRDGARQFTHHLYIPPGQERRMVVMTIPENQIPLRSGMLVRVTIDGPLSQIPETNEDNNTREIRVAKLDFEFRAPQSSLQLSKLYMQGGDDFRVRFQIKVLHNMNSVVRNVHVHWTLSGPDGPICDYNHIFAEVPPGFGYTVWEVDEKFGKQGRPNAHWPALREGVTYRVSAGITDPGDDFYEVNPANDSATFTFSFPD